MTIRRILGMMLVQWMLTPTTVGAFFSGNPADFEIGSRMNLRFSGSETETGYLNAAELNPEGGVNYAFSPSFGTGGRVEGQRVFASSNLPEITIRAQLTDSFILSNIPIHGRVRQQLVVRGDLTSNFRLGEVMVAQHNGRRENVRLRRFELIADDQIQFVFLRADNSELTITSAVRPTLTTRALIADSTLITRVYPPTAIARRSPNPRNNGTAGGVEDVAGGVPLR